MNSIVYINIIMVFLFGSIIGLAELLNRYPETKYLFGATFLISFGYIVFNGLISVLALFFLWHIKSIEINQVLKVDFSNIFYAGFGGMAILRSSFFTINLNGQKVDVGFMQLINTFLYVIDRKISNTIAPKKLKEVSKIVGDTDFERYKYGILALSTTFTNHFTKNESEYLNKLIEELSTDSTLTNWEKMLKLGSEVSKFCDTEMLKTVLETVTSPERKAQEEQKRGQEELDFYIKKLIKK
ncbi:MAG: hypothetical protein ACFFG0_24675 [Candidatus Thorarchaeota archaeon]